MHNEVSFPLHAACGAAYLTAPNIAARHAFSTRLGGVSTGVLESLNLSVRRGDTPENVRENWRRLGAAAGLDLTRAVYAQQVHSAEVRIAHAADAQPPELEPRFACDGFVTNEPGVPLAVCMADCLPALLHDPAAGVIGAVHCGWRGSVADILGAAVAQMCALGAHPADIRAAIGPGIGACCFEVGPEVVAAAEALLHEPLGALVRPRADGKALLDLKGVNARRLAQLGVAFGRGGFAGAVAHEQDVHRLDALGQRELLADGFGLEHADPQRVEPERCGRQHHVVGDDRGVDVADLLTVVLAGPDLVRVGADDDGERSPEVARAACQALHAFRRFDDDKALRLAVGARRGHTARLEDGCDLFRFHFPLLVAAAGIPLFGQREKIHSLGVLM